MALPALSGFRKLRNDLVIARQETPEGVLFIVKEPEERRFYKFEEADYAVVECFRDAGSLEEVIGRFERSRPGQRLDPDAAREFEASLAEMGLLEKTTAEKNLMVMEKVKDSRRKKRLGREQNSIFFITFPAIDPDRFLNRIHPYLKVFYQPWFVALSLAGMVVMAGIFAVRWDQIAQSTLDFYNFREKTAYDILQFLLLMFVIVTIHEFGHALTCKHFGGEVHEIGFVLFYFTPAFYCDVNDAYLFPKKWHKLWVTFAGAYIELFICVLATFAWLWSRPDSALHGLTYKVILFTGLSSIVFNINPLVKLDGYYALMDWLEIPNLSERAYEYLGYLIRSRVLGMKVPRPVTTRRQRRIFIVYSVLSICYTVVLLWFVFGVARNWLNALFPGWGFLLALGIVTLILRRRLAAGGKAVRGLWGGRKGDRMTWRGWLLASGGTGAALALLILPRFPVTIESAVRLEPERVIHLAARAEGIVETILAGEGDRVREGETVARLRNDDLALLLRAAETRRTLANSAARASHSEGRTADWMGEQRRLEELDGRVEELRRQAASLELRAPEGAILLTPRVEDQVGTYRKAGETVLDLGSTGRMKALIRVSEWDVRWVRGGQEVRIHLEAFPFRSFPGRILKVAPAGSDTSPAGGEPVVGGGAPYRVFEVLVLLENPKGLLRPGMAGVAKIYARPLSLAGRMIRFAADLSRSVIW